MAKQKLVLVESAKKKNKKQETSSLASVAKTVTQATASAAKGKVVTPSKTTTLRKEIRSTGNIANSMPMKRTTSSNFTDKSTIKTNDLVSKKSWYNKDKNQSGTMTKKADIYKRGNKYYFDKDGEETEVSKDLINRAKKGQKIIGHYEDDGSYTYIDDKNNNKQKADIRTVKIDSTPNSEGYTKTNQKYGDYKYQDYANKKDYTIYKKDDRSYYYDPKAKTYIDMDTPTMTTAKEDKKQYKEAIKQGYKGKKTYEGINYKKQVQPSKIAEQVELETSGLTEKEKEKYKKSLIRQEKEAGKDLNYVKEDGLIGAAKDVVRNVDKNAVEPLARAPQSYDYGKLSQDLSMAYYNEMMGKKSNIKELQRKIDNYNKFNKDIVNSNNMLDEHFKNLPNQIGGIKAGIENAGALGAVGAIGGGAIGAATTKTGAGALTGAEKGAKLLGGAGYVKGQTENTLKLEAGAEYQALIEMGVPKNIAKKEALKVGTENALIESGESVLDLLTFGKASAATAALKEGLLKKYGAEALKKWGVSYLTNVASEGGQEGLQEQRSIAGEKRAAEQAGIERDNSQDVNRIIQAGKTGAFSAALTGGATRISGMTGSSVFNTTKEAAMNRVQGLNDKERTALTQVAMKKKRGETLNEQDMAVIAVINNKPVDTNIQAQNQVQQIQIAVQNGKITPAKGTELIKQVQDGTYEKNQNLQAIANNAKQTIVQRLNNGEISQAQATQEMNSITSALAKQQAEINNNVENLSKMEYNNITNTKEGVDNDFRRIQEESRGLSKEQHDLLYEGDKSGIKGVRENISRVLQPRMENIIRSNNDNGKPLKNGFTEVSNTDFEEIFKVNHPYLRNPDTVTPYGADEYKNNKNYLSDDGLSGFSITPSGDLISVFNNSGKPGMLMKIRDTVKSEAKTLDCFSSKAQGKRDLPNMYADAFGFKTASIMGFNYDIMAEEHGKEYADAFVEKYGEAPVYFMVKTDKNITPKYFNKDQYEEAMGYRDSFVESEGTSDSSFSNENVNAVRETNDEYLRIDDNGNSKMSNEMPKILDEVQKENKKIDIDTVVDTGMRLLVNKGHNIDKVAKANGINRLKTSYDRTLAVGQEGQNQIKRAQTNLRGKEYNNFKIKDKNGDIKNTNLSYMGIFENAEKSGVPTKVLEEYAVNKLNLDRRASGNKSWVEQFPNMTEEYSENVIDDIEKIYPEIKRCHGNLTQYFANIREKMVDSGIISKDSKEYYDMNTPNYVPIQKAVGRRGSSVSSSQNAKGVKTYNQKKIKGGNFDIQPLRETGAQFTLDTLATMRKNIVGQQLGKIIAPEYNLDAAELGENYDQETAKKLGKGEYTLTYFENGEAKTIPIDSGIYHAMTNPQISEGLKLAGELNQKYGAGLFSRAQRGLLTDKNIYFLFTNFFKDIGDAPINSKYTAKFVKNYPSMVADLSAKGVYSKLYENLGGKASSVFKEGEFIGETNPKNVVTKTIDKVSKGVNKALTPIEVANNFIEQLPRLTEFKSTIEANGYKVTEDGDVVPIEGKNPTKSVDEVLDEAMYNAAEITTNFKRGGTLTKIANRNGATFLNASVQGFDKFIRNFTDVVDTTGAKPKINSKAAVKLMLKATIFGVSTSMLNDAMNGDDDDYKDIPEYQKDNYYLFKLGNHKWLRIPKGRMASIFGDAARRTKNAMKGDDKAFEGFLQQVKNQIAPNSVFTDNVLSGFNAVRNNKSWSGNQIVSDWEKNDEHPEDEYDAKTDEFSKWLGKKLGKSPKKINYLLDQYTGVVGDIALPMMTKYTNTPINNKLGKAFVAPLANKFTTNDIMSNKSQSKFYDEYNKTKDQVSHNQKIGKPNDKTTIKSKYLGDQNKKLAELKTQITKVQESDISNKEKIKKVESLQKQINDISKKSLETSKKVKVDDYLATAGKNIYVKDDKGKWRAETDKAKAKRDELGLPISDFYYYKIEEAYTKPNGSRVDITSGKHAKEDISLVKAFDMDTSDYLKYSSEIGSIRGDKRSNGATIRGSAKRKKMEYINSLPISATQKYLLYSLKVDQKKRKRTNQSVIDTINNSNLSRSEKQELYNYIYK